MDVRGRKNQNDGATRWSKCFDIGLAIETEYRHVTDRWMDRHCTTAEHRMGKSVETGVAKETNDYEAIWCGYDFDSKV